MKTALIIGSTGLTGSHLLQQLLDSNQYDKVISFSREVEVEHPKLTNHIVDFSKPEEYCELVKGDDFFCTIGTTIRQAGSEEAFRKVDFVFPKNFAKCAMDNGVSRFLIISALGADSKASNYYMKTKGEIEDFLKVTNFRSVAIMQPSLLLGDRKEFRFAEKIGGVVMKFFSFAFVGLLAKYKAIESKTLANALFIIAQKNTTGFTVYESDKIQEIGKVN